MVRPTNGDSYTCKDMERSVLRQLRKCSWVTDDISTSVAHVVCGLTEEAGEVAGLLKREFFKGKKVDLERWIDELGDVLWYIIVVAACKGVSLDEIFTYNQKKLTERYGEF